MVINFYDKIGFRFIRHFLMNFFYHFDKDFLENYKSFFNHKYQYLFLFFFMECSFWLLKQLQGLSSTKEKWPNWFLVNFYFYSQFNSYKCYQYFIYLLSKSHLSNYYLVSYFYFQCILCKLSQYSLYVGQLLIDKIFIDICQLI